MPTRSFLALDLPHNVKDAIQALQQTTEQNHPGLYRWSPPENLHLTVNFLGDLEDQAFETVKTLPIKFPPLILKTGNILTIPERTVPKILALNLAGDTNALRQLHQRIQDATITLVPQTEARAFTPHITLGRLKKGIPPSAKPVKRLVGSFTPPKPLEWTLDELWLYTSTLTKEGPVYEKVHRYPADR